MSTRGLRVVFLGTPEFAVPALEGIAASRHALVGAVSQPDRARGRGRRAQPTPVHAAVERLGLPLLQPERVAEPTALEWMRALRPDVGVVVAFGQFIPRTARELPRLGMINAHGSLLPRHRGAAPIAHAIASGDVETGISVMRVVREMDAGDVCGERRTKIGPEETAGELAQRLAPMAAEALVEALDALEEGRAVFQPQDAARATQAGKLDRGWGALDWREPREPLLRRLRAATPWPGCDVQLVRSGRRLRLLRARSGADFEGAPAPLGRVELAAGALRIAAVDGWVDVVRLQEPGRRALDADAFARGARLPEDEEISTG